MKTDLEKIASRRELASENDAARRAFKQVADLALDDRSMRILLRALSIAWFGGSFGADTPSAEEHDIAEVMAKRRVKR